MNVSMDRWMYRWIDGWIDGSMDGSMDRWIDGSMDDWHGIRIAAVHGLRAFECGLARSARCHRNYGFGMSGSLHLPSYEFFESCYNTSKLLNSFALSLGCPVRTLRYWALKIGLFYVKRKKKKRLTRLLIDHSAQTKIRDYKFVPSL
jgi:hypothetical protein